MAGSKKRGILACVSLFLVFVILTALARARSDDHRCRWRGMRFIRDSDPAARFNLPASRKCPVEKNWAEEGSHVVERQATNPRIGGFRLN